MSVNNPNSEAEKNNNSYKKLVKRDGVRRVVAISDIHGWYEPFIELLEISGIIKQVVEAEDVLENEDVFIGGGGEAYYQYVGDETTVVLVGDIVDGDANSKKIIDLLLKLESRADMAGGEVITLMGNHEKGLLQTSWKGLDFEVHSPHCELDQNFNPRQWIKERPIVAIVNDVLFVHGGITGKVLKRVKNAQTKDEDFTTAFGRLLEHGSIMDVLTSGCNWSYEGDTLRDVLERTDTNYIVIGHISTYGKTSCEIRLIGASIGGQPRVFAIDTEISDYKQEGRGSSGGALSLRWEEEGIVAEYLYRNRSSRKIDLIKHMRN
ncbi:MAG: metallophosphoesterase [Halobacteriota archaeon]|nr:metallophosphoesterase [Halobacteriota archaeon]